MKNKSFTKNDQPSTFFYIKWGLKFLFFNSPMYVFYRVAVALLGSLIGILDLYMIRFAVNTLHTGAPFSRAISYLVILIVSYIIYSVAYELVSSKAKPYFDNLLKNVLNKKIYEKTVECDYSSYEDPAFYEQYILAASGAPATLMDVLYTSIDLLVKFVELLLAGTLTLLIDEFTILFAFLPFVLVPIYAKSSKLRYQMRREINNENRKTEYARSAFFDRQYAKEIRLTNIINPLINLYKNANREIKKIYHKTGRKRAIISILENIIQAVLSQYVIMGYIAYKVLISKTMLFGDGIVLVSAIEVVFFSIDQLLVDFKDLHASSLNVKDLVNFLETKPIVVSGSKAVTSFSGIKFSNVSFQYSGAESYALENISFSINKGEKIAIVGENGSGKTTLMKLLLRLYDPTNGEISLNGNNITEFSLPSYRHLYSEVFQDFYLFAFSIQENIHMGEVTSPESIRKAIADSHFERVVDSLPKKEETIVGKEYDPNGVVLSGGQRQQLKIAASYFKEAEIYLFDEPSSALDPEAEAKMFQDLFNISRDKTVIFSSHRLSSAKSADKILFLKEGKLTEYGAFKDLIQKNGEFAKLFKMQATNYSEC